MQSRPASIGRTEPSLADFCNELACAEPSEGVKRVVRLQLQTHVGWKIFHQIEHQARASADSTPNTPCHRIENGTFLPGGAARQIEHQARASADSTPNTPCHRIENGTFLARGSALDQNRRDSCEADDGNGWDSRGGTHPQSTSTSQGGRNRAPPNRFRGSG